MPQELPFGKEMPKRGGSFLRMKNKGDKIIFRIAQNPVFEGKHFMQTDEKWDVHPCSRINENQECDLCELFFAAKQEAKDASLVKDKEKAEACEKEARKYRVAVIFYFSILNRDTEEAVILQTTEGVRNQINAQFEAGVKVFDRDLVLKNTGSESPKDRYVIAVVDSSESKKLTTKEKKALKEAKEHDMNTINDGKSNRDEMADNQVEDKPITEKEFDELLKDD